jgi:hypothetical protein
MRTRIVSTFTRRQRAFVFLAITLAAATVAGTSFTAARSWARRPHTAAEVAPATPLLAPIPPINAERSSVEVLPIYLRRPGFAPGEITRPAGDYFLAVKNISGVPDIVLRLDREKGGRLHEVKVMRDRPAWRQNVRLTPGVYLLTEADHPDWVCRITVTAR